MPGGVGGIAEMDLIGTYCVEYHKNDQDCR